MSNIAPGGGGGTVEIPPPDITEALADLGIPTQPDGALAKDAEITVDVAREAGALTEDAAKSNAQLADVARRKARGELNVPWGTDDPAQILEGCRIAWGLDGINAWVSEIDPGSCSWPSFRCGGMQSGAQLVEHLFQKFHVARNAPETTYRIQFKNEGGALRGTGRIRFPSARAETESFGVGRLPPQASATQPQMYPSQPAAAGALPMNPYLPPYPYTLPPGIPPPPGYGPSPPGAPPYHGGYPGQQQAAPSPPPQAQAPQHAAPPPPHVPPQPYVVPVPVPQPAPADPAIAQMQQQMAFLSNQVAEALGAFGELKRMAAPTPAHAPPGMLGSAPPAPAHTQPPPVQHVPPPAPAAAPTPQPPPPGYVPWFGPDGRFAGYMPGPGYGQQSPQPQPHAQQPGLGAQPPQPPPPPPPPQQHHAGPTVVGTDLGAMAAALQQFQKTALQIEDMFQGGRRDDDGGGYNDEPPPPPPPEPALTPIVLGGPGAGPGTPIAVVKKDGSFDLGSSLLANIPVFEKAIKTATEGIKEANRSRPITVNAPQQQHQQPQPHWQQPPQRMAPPVPLPAPPRQAPPPPPPPSPGMGGGIVPD